MIRRRAAALLALLLMGVIVLAPIAHASNHVVRAQENSTGGSEGAGSDEAESGASGGSEPATPEAGPPWTYQMAWITALILVLILLMTGLQYYRMVVRRQKGQV